jgi:hypothetical protein
MSNSESTSFVDFVRLVLDALDAAGVDYLIGGAVALAAWGDPRTTRDLDLVVDLPLEAMADLSRELEKRGMLVPVEVLVDFMIENRADSPINAIHMHSGYKAKLFLLKPGDVFREMNLKRRRLVDLGPPLGQVYVHAPEDLILNKLHYFTISQQSKHIRDIAGIVLNLGEALDDDYIDQWAARLQLTETWREVQRQIER